MLHLLTKLFHTFSVGVLGFWGFGVLGLRFTVYGSGFRI